MIARKPSHFGSYDAPAGMVGTDFANIGAIGGITGSFIGPVSTGAPQRGGTDAASCAPPSPIFALMTDVPQLDSARRLSALLGLAALAHAMRPEAYDSLVPPVLKYRRAIVYASGIAELACAGAVAAPATRRRGAQASAALFVGVFPANVYMVFDREMSAAKRVFGVLRLPFQIPLVTWALRIARDAQSAGANA